MPRTGHALTPEQREARDARMRELYRAMRFDRSHAEAVDVLARRFGADRRTVNEMIKKSQENAR